MGGLLGGAEAILDVCERGRGGRSRLRVSERAWGEVYRRDPEPCVVYRTDSENCLMYRRDLCSVCLDARCGARGDGLQDLSHRTDAVGVFVQVISVLFVVQGQPPCLACGEHS